MMAGPDRLADAPPAEVWNKVGIGSRASRQFLRLLPIPLFRRLVPRKVIGFCYHVVSNQTLPHVEHLYRYKTAEQFEKDLLYLKKIFRLLSFEELLYERHDQADRRLSAVVTFDDGFAECFTIARPLLLEHKVPCIFFVTPEVLDNRRMFAFDKASLCIGALTRAPRDEISGALNSVRDLFGVRCVDLPSFAGWVTRWVRTADPQEEERLDRLCAVLKVDVARYLQQYRPYMTSDQVQTLAKDGFAIGGHALRHIAIGSLTSAAEVSDHIVGSCDTVRQLTGTERVPFAFPFDADGVNRELLAEILRRHPHIGPLFDTRRLQLDRDFIVNRIIVDSPPALGRVRSNLSGYLRHAYWDELVRSRPTPRTRLPAAQPEREVHCA